MIRRVGDAPQPGKRYKFRPGAYAILPNRGQLLLTRQAGSNEPLQLPGGGIDPGETPIRALHREVFEETGWRIACLTRIGTVRRFVFMPEYDLWAEKLCIAFLARPVRRLGPPSEPDHAVEFVPIDVAQDRLDNPVDRAMLNFAWKLDLFS